MIRCIYLILVCFFLTNCSYTPEQTPQSIVIEFCERIHFQDSVSISKELYFLRDSMNSKTGVYVLEEGDASMVSRAWLTEHAEKSIDIQYFIFSTDNVGLIACDYLVRAANKGVKVRILVDDIMVEATGNELLMIDSHENIEIKIYNPGSNVGKSVTQKLKKVVFDFQGFNQRMHNKTFIVDGKVVITGGRNIADEYFDYDHAYNFRDRDVLLLGNVCGDISKSFIQFWDSEYSVPVSSLVESIGLNLQDPNRFNKLHQYACDSSNFWPQVRQRITQLPEAFKEIVNSGQLVWCNHVSFVSDVPGKNMHKKIKSGGVTTDSLIALVKNAKTSIEIQSPYLITTDLGKQVLSEAVKRGVKIRILTNSLASTDNLEAFSGYQRDREALLQLGVRIFEFKPDAKERYKIMTGALQKTINYSPIFGLHAKSMVIDDYITVVGTFNLDPRSAHLNTECITIIRDKTIASGVLKGMETEFDSDNSWEVTFDFNPDKEAGTKKQVKAWTRKIVPKEIL